MIWRRCVIVSSLISLVAFGCSDSATSSSIEKTRQVVQDSNVAQLLTEAQDSQKAKTLLLQGNNLLDAQRYQDALIAYNQAVIFKSDSVEIWVNRGNALTALQRYEEALESYDKAIALQPNKDEAWYNRGNVLTSLRRYPEAVKAYDEAIAIMPEKHEAWINRGIALTKLQRYQEALASYNQALTIKSDLHQAYYNKACNYALQGHVDLAIESLAKAIKLVPSKYQQLAKTDADFNLIRNDKRFQELIK
jgi:tetratricopeptide (TPR) repeat protein